LFRFPAQLEALRKSPQLAAPSIEEILRFDGPVHRLGRIAKEDTEIGGKIIFRGQKLILLIAAANRDPEVFENPDEFNIRRAPNPHLGFGRGIHFCPGAPLARMEAEIVLRLLFEKAPLLSLERPLEQSFVSGFRGPRSIPLLLAR
jgi:cytochrome P450